MNVSIFVSVENLGGVRYVSVIGCCTAINLVEKMKYLVDVSFPNNKKILLVTDNLNNSYDGVT